MSAHRSSRVTDLLLDVLLELSARKSRTSLIIVAVALSTGALLASIGISATAARQIASSMAASTLDLVTVTVAPAPAPAAESDGKSLHAESETTFPADAESRALSIDLVAAAGLAIDVEPSELTAVSRDGKSGAKGNSLTGLTSGFLNAGQAQLRNDRTWFLDGDEAVAVLGTCAAKQLGIPVTDDPTGYQVWIGREQYQVVDFVETSRVNLCTTVAIPYARAVNYASGDTSARLLVRTAPGAGSPVSGIIRTAVRPDDPERLRSSQVVNLSSIRRGVDSQLARLAGWIGAFLLALTCLLIANSMVVSVVARTAEIGLRRALGTSRLGVSAVFWCEGLVVGLVGGTTGSALGATAVLAVSTLNEWSAHPNALLLLAGPVLGGLTGLIASAYPAWRVTKISPALAVRSD